MSDELKRLGASAPSATTETDLYTVPNLTQTTCSSLVVCNRSSAAGTFRISVSPGGSATANADYLFYDCPISGNQTINAIQGLTLAQTDVVRVYDSTGTLSFGLFGCETITD